MTEQRMIAELVALEDARRAAEQRRQAARNRQTRETGRPRPAIQGDFE